MNQTTPIQLTDDELDSFIAILTDKTGIVPRASHRDGIRHYLENKILETKLSVSDFRLRLLSNPNDFSNFVNESTVNETYFFREEKQFIFLRDKIFSGWRLRTGRPDIRMWSAACSYGEEAYSLAILALTCGLKPTVAASDINSEVLEHCKSGVYLGTSLRSMDGTSFGDLITPYRRSDHKFEFRWDIRECVKPMQLNLAEIDSPFCESLLPKNQDIIFLRNVFIYFTQELRSRILRTIADKCLAENGYLFVSMNEIAQLDTSIIPPSLVKEADGNIFYFHKTTGGKANG